MTSRPLSPHPTEDDLILYQLHEAADRGAERTIREHLEVCPACCELASSIAETLRVFSAEPVPPPDVAEAWQRLRPRLMAASAPVSRGSQPPFAVRRVLLFPLAGLAVAALLLVVALVARHRSEPKVDPKLAHLAPGPLSTHPADSRMAAHLDQAERFLTEVSHSSEPLDPSARQEAHSLLLQNAVYVRTAQHSGDFADAAVLEKLGYLLTTVDHEPDASEPGWHVRFELSAHGLLLDLRILRQNQTHQNQGELP